jgi:large subunit ribosomal protein L3
MIEGLWGKKLGMTQIFDESGGVIPVSVIELGPCVITQVKTLERDGYEALQLGVGQKKRLNKPERGHRRKAGASARTLREVKVQGAEEYETGQVLKCDIFEAGQKVDVTGTSKGKGFAGTVKRHGFAGGPKTHGQSDRLRAPGAIGGAASPGRVFKGMRMAGRMGNERKTVQNLEVVRVDPERNLLLVRGSVPGADNGLVLVKHAVKPRERAAAAAAS